jgi:hypothetical protein
MESADEAIAATLTPATSPPEQRPGPATASALRDALQAELNAVGLQLAQLVAQYETSKPLLVKRCVDLSERIAQVQQWEAVATAQRAQNGGGA